MAVTLTEIQRAGATVKCESDGSISVTGFTDKNITYQSQGTGFHDFKVGATSVLQITSTGQVQVLATAGITSEFKIEHTDNTNAASHARLLLKVGGASGGDPYIRFQNAGLFDYSLGMDNTDDSFRLSASSVLGTTDRLVIDSNGIVFINTTGSSGRLNIAAAQPLLRLDRTDAGNSDFIEFRRAGSLISTIRLDASDIFTITDTGTVDIFKLLSTKHAVIGCHSAQISTANMFASSVSFHVNEGSDLLTFTVKYADGVTVKTGTVALA